MVRLLVDDLRLYAHLAGMQVRAQTQYKTSLAIDIVTYLIVTTLEFAALVIAFGPFPRLGSWHVGEVALLYAVTTLSFGLAELLGAGIDLFPDTIRRGEFDRVLLRPAGVLLQVVAADLRLRRLGRLTQGLLVFALALHLLPRLSWTLSWGLLLLSGMAGTTLIFIAVMLLGATQCFWTVETSELTNILTYGGREMLSYPLSIYNTVLQRFFLFVVPLAFGAYLPVCALLGKPLPFGLPLWIPGLSLPVALVFAAVAVMVWRIGVRHYQSTGS